MRLSPETPTLHQTSYWTSGESAQKHTARKKQWGRWWLLPHQKQKAGRKWDIIKTRKENTPDLTKILDLVTIIFFLPKIYFYHFSECVSAWRSVNVSPGAGVPGCELPSAGAENQTSILQEQHALLLFLYRNNEFNSHVCFWFPTISMSDHHSHYALS